MKQLIFDIGGTYIKYAYFIDEKVTTGSFPVVDKNGQEDVPNALRNFLKNYQVDEIGVSMPGPFDFDEGISLMDFKLPSIYKVNVKQIFKDIFPNAKIVFIHDAVAFSLGALSEDAKLKEKKIVAIMLGTGLGYGYIDHGRVIVDKAKTTFPCVGRLPYLDSVIEDYASASAIVRLANKEGYHFKYVKEMADEANHDNKIKQIFYQVGKTLGEVMNARKVVTPFNHIMIGGGASNVWHLLKEGFESVCKISYQIIKDSTMCPMNGVRLALKLNDEKQYLKIVNE